MLKWQENFLAGESVKDPEKIKKKLINNLLQLKALKNKRLRR